jgi:hypothetical protein
MGPITINRDRRLSGDANANEQELQGMIGLPVVMTAANILRQKFAASPHSSRDRRGSRSASGVLAGQLPLTEEPANTTPEDEATEEDDVPPQGRKKSADAAKELTEAASALMINNASAAAAEDSAMPPAPMPVPIPHNNIGVDPNSLLERMENAGLVDSRGPRTGSFVLTTTATGDRGSPTLDMISVPSSPGSPAGMMSLTLPPIEISTSGKNPLVSRLQLDLLNAQNEKNDKAKKKNKEKDKEKDKESKEKQKDKEQGGDNDKNKDAHTKGASARSDSSAGSEDSDGVFEIPSVFGTARTPSRCESEYS